MMARAAGALAGVARSIKVLSEVGAAKVRDVKELVSAKQERKEVFMLCEVK